MEKSLAARDLNSLGILFGGTVRHGNFKSNLLAPIDTYFVLDHGGYGRS